MADHHVKIVIDGPYGPWEGYTTLTMVSDDDPLRGAFELGGLAADAIAEAADAGDLRAASALEARARPMLGVARG